MHFHLRKLAGRVATSGFCAGFEDAKLLIDALIGKGFSAIGAAGFCWGAKIVTALAKSESIQASVLLYPSFISVMILRVDSYVKIFPKAAHGWAVRYDVDNEGAAKSAEEAHK
ncbi:putative alpha/Beta hydrolase [Rosa chinensis]|uniref:Putative alpha/Beta hydrolase n=1 Tax=Rosa chinensis TaxID=74649 RepID=A0A2P6PF76_ROSCH|nr:putative alpha/Beta hydrolase [Rosa chinensis]